MSLTVDRVVSETMIGVERSERIKSEEEREILEKE